MRLISQKEATINGRRVTLIETPVVATASIGNVVHRNVTPSSVERIRRLLRLAWGKTAHATA